MSLKLSTTSGPIYKRRLSQQKLMYEVQFLNQIHQLIWLLCTWIVCNERNNRLFNNTITIVPRLLDKVKLLSLG